MARSVDQEIAERCGTWGVQRLHRHGTQPGYGVYPGRKEAGSKPRVRAEGRSESGLRTCRLLQDSGRMQKAVAGKLLCPVSTRKHEGAIDESSVRRH